MLTAISPSGDVVVADRALERDSGYRCRGCQLRVDLRKGAIKIPHFAHHAQRGPSEEPCSADRGMTKEHLELQMRLFRQFGPTNCTWVSSAELEARGVVPGRIADVLIVTAAFRVAVEVQISAYSRAEVAAKLSDYETAGVRCWYVVGPSVLPLPAEPRPKLRIETDLLALPDWVRYLARRQHGILTVGIADGFWAVRLDGVRGTIDVLHEHEDVTGFVPYAGDPVLVMPYDSVWRMREDRALGNRLHGAAEADQTARAKAEALVAEANDAAVRTRRDAKLAAEQTVRRSQSKADRLLEAAKREVASERRKLADEWAALEQFRHKVEHAEAMLEGARKQTDLDSRIREDYVKAYRELEAARSELETAATTRMRSALGLLLRHGRTVRLSDEYCDWFVAAAVRHAVRGEPWPALPRSLAAQLEDEPRGP